MVIDIKTHMIWYEQVLRPSSTRFIRAKILDMKKPQSLALTQVSYSTTVVDDLTRCHDELFEIVLH